MSDTQAPQSTRRLGRGLSALLGGNGPAFTETVDDSNSELRNISVNQLVANPFQPRQVFDAEALGELASSIKEHGVLQPILVRESQGGYQVIAGERRWKAAQKAGLTTIPCRIVDVIDKTACEYALEENLKRKDLSDLEKAQAFRDYINQFECSIEELSKQLSMSRSAVSNMLRLLELPAQIKTALNSGKISAGHARALLPLPEADQLELASRIQTEQLSVRAVEATVKKMLGRDTPKEEAASEPTVEQSIEPAVTSEISAGLDNTIQSQIDAVEKIEAHSQQSENESSGNDGATIPLPAPQDSHRTHHVDSLEAQLRDLLGVKVDIQLNAKDSGKIVVPFSSNQEFERILSILRRHAA